MSKMDLSLSLALTMAGPIPPIRSSSLRSSKNMDRPHSVDFSLYKGVSDRPLGWKPRRSTKPPALGSTAKDFAMRRWNGAARSSTDWDGLRRDPELWDARGNCLVHLYGRGQSRRGPAFRVPLNALLSAGCRPLLERFMVHDSPESPVSATSSSEDGSYFGQPRKSGNYELYIPAPPTAERGQAFLYHSATRNFFAWVLGKSLVGTHLGGALVGLLNSMNEFRSVGQDNVQAIMDYMDEEAYADMRNSPDHALAVLFFAEHFQFKDLYVDAFAHCCGMHDKLFLSSGYEFMSRTSRALITRSRLEMDMRLDHAAKMLGSFLSEDLSDAYLGLSTGARAHLEKFRSFLLSYYVAKLGYYPPKSSDGIAAFPKNIYGQMCSEFQKLYDFLVDSEFISSESSPTSQQGGICVLQSVQAFDSQHKYTSLPNPLPLLPKVEDAASTGKAAFGRRLSWHPKSDKMKPDPRLVTYSSLSKATNRKDQVLYDCSLVRAYKGFEKDCIFNPSKADKSEKLSHTDARKVRWILIYSVLQTLISVTRVPDEVRDIHNVPYNLCVLTAGCPSWKGSSPYETLLRTQTEQTKEDLAITQAKPEPMAQIVPLTDKPLEIKPDVDYFALTHRPQQSRENSTSTIGTLGTMVSRRGTIRKALSTLGNMPELRHPTPKRPIYHEILVHGYGNGTNTVSITAGRCSPATEEPEEDQELPRKFSTDSESSSTEDLSSRWSRSSYEADGFGSPRISVSSTSRRGSDVSAGDSKIPIRDFIERPMSTIGLVHVPSSIYSVGSLEDHAAMQPDPLQLKKNAFEGGVKVTKEVKVTWDHNVHGKANDELLAYLNG